MCSSTCVGRKSSLAVCPAPCVSHACPRACVPLRVCLALGDRALPARASHACSCALRPVVLGRLACGRRFSSQSVVRRGLRLSRLPPHLASLNAWSPHLLAGAFPPCLPPTPAGSALALSGACPWRFCAAACGPHACSRALRLPACGVRAWWLGPFLLAPPSSPAGSAPAACGRLPLAVVCPGLRLSRLLPRRAPPKRPPGHPPATLRPPSPQPPPCACAAGSPGDRGSRTCSALRVRRWEPGRKHIRSC